MLNYFEPSSELCAMCSWHLHVFAACLPVCKDTKVHNRVSYDKKLFLIKKVLYSKINEKIATAMPPKPTDASTLLTPKMNARATTNGREKTLQ